MCLYMLDIVLTLVWSKKVIEAPQLLFKEEESWGEVLEPFTEFSFTSWLSFVCWVFVSISFKFSHLIITHLFTSLYVTFQFALGFFGGWRCVLGVGCCVVSTPPALGLRYHNQELFIFSHDLTGLVVPSSAPSCWWASGGLAFVAIAIGYWWLPFKMRRS